MIAFLYLWIVFDIFFDLNLVSWSRNSTTDIIFTGLFALLLTLQYYFDVYLGSTLSVSESSKITQMNNNNQWELLWSLALQEHNLEIEHIKEKENIMADVVSLAM